jgi:hypothetical protein
LEEQEEDEVELPEFQEIRNPVEAESLSESSPSSSVVHPVAWTAVNN